MTHLEDHRTVVVGTGQAAFELCAKLRALGVKGPIALVGEEPHLPYQRPPLSKAYLLGKIALDRLFFRHQAFYEKNAINLFIGLNCTLVDRKEKTIMLSDGTCLPYDTLVLATGASAIRLPAAIGGNLNHVHCIRSLGDADAMSDDLVPGRSVLIVGGGYIGLEAAAVATELGMKVTLVEAADRILARVAASETSAYFRRLHTEHGVDLREGVKLTRLIEVDSTFIGAELNDGSQLKVNVVIVGIGIKPNQALAAAAGLTIENGIKVDANLRTSDPSIYAIGDCASFPHGETHIRLESVGNAIDQARVAAMNIAGEPQRYKAKPWFWSDQYDVKLQIVGFSSGHTHVVTRGEFGGPVSHWYFNKNQLVAVDAMNEPKAYVVAKRLIDNGHTADPGFIADSTTNLKELI